MKTNIPKRADTFRTHSRSSPFCFGAHRPGYVQVELAVAEKRNHLLDPPHSLARGTCSACSRSKVAQAANKRCDVAKCVNRKRATASLPASGLAAVTGQAARSSGQSAAGRLPMRARCFAARTAPKIRSPRGLVLQLNPLAVDRVRPRRRLERARDARSTSAYPWWLLPVPAARTPQILPCWWLARKFVFRQRRRYGRNCFIATAERAAALMVEEPSACLHLRTCFHQPPPLLPCSRFISPRCLPHGPPSYPPYPHGLCTAQKQTHSQ